MGLHLFVKEDGNYQGWLAALLCCWAAVNEDEYPIEKRIISRPSSGARNTIWNEQPTPLQQMPYFPTNPSFTGSVRDTHYIREAHSAFDEHDRVRPISERPPSLRPLSFGEPSLLDKMHLKSRRKSSTNLQLRASIGRPLDFRRLEYSEKQRMSLKPLQLSPVVLRDAVPEPNVFDRSMNRSDRSVEDLDHGVNRDSYRNSRGSPFEQFQQLSSNSSPYLSSACVTHRDQVIMESIIPQPTGKPTLSTRSSSSSIRSLRRQAMESSASLASIPSRPSSERSRPKRKRSYQRSGDSTDVDVDREILELNTIIEERRAESAKSPSHSEGHVAAVAPSMPVRARSETLTDIGSAFSRPLAPKSTSDIAFDDERSESSARSPVKSRLSRPFMFMPDAAAFERPAQQQQPQQRPRRSSSRVAGWLSNILGSPHTSSFNSANDYYQTSLRGRAVSETSLCTTGTIEHDSPMASSPMSKGPHSRSLTADSRTTPPSTVEEDTELAHEGKETEPWPTLAQHVSEVGVAL